MKKGIPCIFLLGLLIGHPCLTAADSSVRPGDRIAIVGNTYADQLRVHGYLETLLLQRSVGEAISIRNLGWGGDMLNARDRPTNFPSEASTLTDHQTDVIIACFGMGESFAGESGLDDYRRSLKAFIAAHKGKKYNGESVVRLVLLSPIAHEDLGELTPNRDTRNRDLALYVRAMQDVAAAGNVPCVDLYTPTLYLMEDDASPRLTENGIHLNSYGYWAASRMVADALLPGKPSWWLSVDARSGRANARGARVSAIKSQGRGLHFTVQEETPPGLSPPVRGKIHKNLANTRDTLVVENLAPGKYLLTIDGQPVAEGSHEQWATGVAVDKSPAHKEAEAYRQQVNDKNLQFTYSWKALNQVHIVGERRKSASGASLPAEVVAFAKLAEQKDKALQGGITLKTRQWRLVPQ